MTYHLLAMAYDHDLADDAETTQINGVFFGWFCTPEGPDYWQGVYRQWKETKTISDEAQSKLDAMRTQYEEEKA